MPPSTPPSTPKRPFHRYSPYTPTPGCTRVTLPPTPKSGKTKRITSSRTIVDSDSSSLSLAEADHTSSSDGDEIGSLYTPTSTFGEEERMVGNLSEGEGEDVKPKIHTSFNKGKKITAQQVKVKAEKDINGKPKGHARRSNGPKAAPRAWDGNEDWIMFSHLHPKVSKPDWAEVARQVGNARDAKSCQNRYAALSKKVESAIKSQSSSA